MTTDVTPGTVRAANKGPQDDAHSTLARLRTEINRGRLLWLWPALVITAIALAGAVFGPEGALLATALIVGLLAFFTGRRLEPRKPMVWAYLTTACGAVVVLLLVWQLPSAPPRGDTGPVDLRGRTPTLEQLARSNLRGARLAGAVLDGRDLRQHDLSGAEASGARFRGANLSRTPLRGADLRGADFSGACLRYADLSGAQLAGAIVAGADLTGITVPADAAATLVGKPLPAGAQTDSCD